MTGEAELLSICKFLSNYQQKNIETNYTINNSDETICKMHFMKNLKTKTF